MTSNSRIPQHLAPYVERIPKDSLILLTGTLSNNANWLVVRYLCDAFSNDASLKNRPAGDISDGGAATREEVGVVLVSWMRDFEFWKTEARRSGVSVGHDLNSLAQSKRLVFVDGLSSSTPSTATSHVTSQIRQAPPTRTIATARDAFPTKGPPSSTALRTPAITHSSTTAPTTPPKESPHAQPLPSLEFAAIQRAIESAITSATASTVILILDAPDVLLALQGPTSKASPSTALQSLILSLRLHSRVHATILSLASDATALPSAPRPDHHIPTLLETESQALLVGLGHVADLVMTVRGLDTGAAGDVGGVIRVSAPGRDGDDDEGVVGKKEWKEQELLYLCKTDGSAKVWERGAGVGIG